MQRRRTLRRDDEYSSLRRDVANRFELLAFDNATVRYLAARHWPFFESFE